MARYGWRLLATEQCAERACAALHAGQALDPRRAAVYAYSQALHTACSGAEGAARQNLGYTELFHYLYNSAARRYPDVCEDATQRALERTFVTFGCCREPGAFLAFGLQQLMDAARALRRQEDHQAQSLSTPVGDGEDTLGTLLPDHRARDPERHAIVQEQQARARQLAAEFVHSHPRAGRQMAALWLKYIEGLDEATISRRLGKPARSLYVLRSRAIARLQAEPGWQALAREW
jgi:DNA-directed RNA polymerase specialized sigma24 family protein